MQPKLKKQEPWVLRHPSSSSAGVDALVRAYPGGRARLIWCFFSCTAFLWCRILFRHFCQSSVYDGWWLLLSLLMITSFPTNTKIVSKVSSHSWSEIGTIEKVLTMYAHFCSLFLLSQPSKRLVSKRGPFSWRRGPVLDGSKSRVLWQMSICQPFFLTKFYVGCSRNPMATEKKTFV